MGKIIHSCSKPPTSIHVTYCWWYTLNILHFTGFRTSKHPASASGTPPTFNTPREAPLPFTKARHQDACNGRSQPFLKGRPFWRSQPGWGPREGARFQLRYSSGWILWCMVDVTIEFMGFINQLMTRGRHPLGLFQFWHRYNIHWNIRWILQMITLWIQVPSYEVVGVSFRIVCYMFDLLRTCLDPNDD